MKNETDALKEAIHKLEKKRANELELLKAQFQTTQESLKPINLIKSTIHEVSTSPEIKNNIIANVIGLGTAIVTKKLFIGGSHNPLKNLFGTLMQFVIGNVVASHANGMKSKISSFIHFYMKRRNESKMEMEDLVKNSELKILDSQKKTFKN